MSSPQPVSLSDVLAACVRNWWLLVAVAVVGLIGGYLLSFLYTPMFSSQATLSFESQGEVAGGKAGGLSGLASLAGISLGASSGRERSVAALKSRVLLASLIEKDALLPILFAEDWDPAAKAWRTGEDRQHSITEGVRLLAQKYVKVDEDNLTGILEVRVRWTDPQTARRWLTSMLSLVNSRLQAETITESERNVRFLQERLQESTLVELRSTLANMIGVELKSQMLAKGKTEFAFRVIDPPYTADKPDSPNRILIAMLCAFLAVLGYFLVVAMRTWLRSQEVRRG